MSSHNCLCDWQAHARSGRRVTLGSATVKLVEDQRLFERIYSNAPVSDAYDEPVGLYFSSYLDRGSRIRIFAGIVQQMHKHFTNARGIDTHGWQVRRHLNLYSVIF